MAETATVLTAEEIERETIKLAADLAFCARGPVNIQLIDGPQLAYTTNTGEENRTIEIRMNPRLIAGIRNKERAIKIWRGGGFHELAHHIWDKDPQYKLATKEGFRDLFNLIDDEQNERRGRALDPEWGACFQSMGAHIFPSKNRESHEQLSTGHAHAGDDKHKRAGKAASKIYTRRWNLFAWHFRRGVPNPSDPVVAEALALIPRRFKDLSADELLALTRNVHETLQQGIELPPEKPAPVKRNNNPAPEEEENSGGATRDGEGSDEEESSDNSLPLRRRVRKLFRSKWAYGLFGLMIIGWVSLFARVETSSWLTMIGLIGIAAVALFIILFIRRAAIKSMLKQHAGAPGKARTPRALWQRSSKRQRVSFSGLAIALTAAGCGSMIYCLGFSWLTIIVLSIVGAGVVFVIGAITCRGPAAALATKSIKAIGPTALKLSRVLMRLPLDWLVWLGKRTWGIIVTAMRAVGAAVVWTFNRVSYAIKRAYHNSRVHFFPWLKKLFDNSLFRLAMLAIPVSAILMMLYAVVVTARSMNIAVLIGLIVVLLLLLALLFIFRESIKSFILNELLMPMPALMINHFRPELDMETAWFNDIDDIVPVEADQALLNSMLPEIQPFAQMLRPYLERCGQTLFDKENEPDGYDLSDELELSLLGETAIFVDEDMREKASIHIEVAVDCSSSMLIATESLAAGEKFELAKKFALMIEQATIGLSNVSGRLWGFTDRKIYDCGTLGERRVSGLVCGGGNNDSAMLRKMGDSAASSGKKVKILAMLSDGQPSDCSWLSLKNLVDSFEQQGMIPWNIALDVIKTPAFERFFTDLVGQTKTEAIVTMGEILASIADGLR